MSSEAWMFFKKCFFTLSSPYLCVRLVRHRSFQEQSLTRQIMIPQKKKKVIWKFNFVVKGDAFIVILFLQKSGQKSKNGIKKSKK